MLNHSLSRYRVFLAVEFIVVVLVLLIFRIVADRGLAGTLAGSLFLISTLAVIVQEWIAVRRVTMALAGGIIFFCGGVFPVLLLRALSWGEPFETASLMGIPGGYLHRASNVFFMIFLIGIFLSLQKARMTEAKKP